MARRSREVRPSATSQSAGGFEVGEHLRLVGAHPGLVPCLALLAAAAQAGDGHLAAELAPHGDERAPRGCLGDVEAAVAGEQRGRVDVDGRGGRVHEEHRHRGAVGRRVAHLRDGGVGDDPGPGGA